MSLHVVDKKIIQCIIHYLLHVILNTKLINWREIITESKKKTVIRHYYIVASISCQVDEEFSLRLSSKCKDSRLNATVCAVCTGSDPKDDRK